MRDALIRKSAADRRLVPNLADPGWVIVGGSLPAATGLALEARMLQEPRVTACCVGEDAVAEGALHESMKLDACEKVDRAVAFAEAGQWEPVGDLLSDVVAASLDGAGARGAPPTPEASQ